MLKDQLLQMIDKHDKILINNLVDSFLLQLGYYKELCEEGQSMMSKLVLSRGSVTQISGGLKKKKELVECIEKERQRIIEPLEQWQYRKDKIPTCPEKEQLNHVLQNVADVIRDFLHEEQQLQQYIEGIVSRHP